MEANPTAAQDGKRKTGLIIALIAIPVAVVLVIFISVAVTFFWFMTSRPYQKWTAKAQPEIIKVEPTTWRESDTTGMRKSSGGTHEVKGFRVTYRFTASSGQVITKTDDRQRSNDPSDMAVVCYDPKEPNNAGLYPVNTPCPIR